MKTYTVNIRIPEGLRQLVDWYRRDRGLYRFNTTIIELLETHPEIAKRWEIVYNTGVEHREHLEHPERDQSNAERDDP